MSTFKKLALVTAMAALPMSGFAMEALDDATMSGVTGQDGITIGLSLTQSMDILIDDTDGLDTGTGPATHNVSGGIYIAGMAITGDATIEIDAGGESTVDGVLVVQVNLDNTFNIDTGDLYAVDTGDAADGTFTAPGATAILDSFNIAFTSGLDLEIQLGDGAANFLELTGNVGTISITNFALNDIVGTGAITAATIDIGGLDLTGTTVALTGTGLEVTMGSNLTAVTLSMTDLALGSAAIVGDVYVTGLSLAGNTISISGK